MLIHLSMVEPAVIVIHSKACSLPVFFFLTRLLSFSRMALLIDKAPIILSLEEVAVHPGYIILAEVDANSVLIISNPQRILGQQLMPCTTNGLNFINNKLITH